jgi:adenylylsulfate kinase-like enzyme
LEADDLVRRLTDSGARTVLIDGRSGAGKTTLAGHLRTRWESNVVVALDDIYAGWDGLANTCGWSCWNREPPVDPAGGAGGTG